MNAELKQVLHKPAKRNAMGEIMHEEYAAVNLNIPLDSEAQHKAVSLLQNLLADPKVVLTIEAKNISMFPPVSVEADEDE